MGGLLVILGLVSGSAAWWGTRALDGRGLAIVRRPDALRQQPGFSANTVGGVGTGDLVQLTTTQEGWARVTHNDGRRGWLPVSQLAPLVPPSVAR
ncbi:MAG: SH3 domain-containing protein, partial [Gemmatimonadaceae bacterium]